MRVKLLYKQCPHTLNLNTDKNLEKLFYWKKKSVLKAKYFAWRKVKIKKDQICSFYFLPLKTIKTKQTHQNQTKPKKHKPSKKKKNPNQPQTNITHRGKKKNQQPFEN